MGALSLQFANTETFFPNPKIFMCKLPPPVTVYVCMCVFSGEGSSGPAAPPRLNALFISLFPRAFKNTCQDAHSKTTTITTTKHRTSAAGKPLSSVGEDSLPVRLSVHLFYLSICPSVCGERAALATCSTMLPPPGGLKQLSRPRTVSAR